MDPQKIKSVKVLLVRHGETEDNKSHTIAGHRPGKLTATGRSQAEKIGAYLAKEKRQFDIIYVSDLGRTRQTFENASNKYPYLKKANVSFTPLVRERGGGILQGKPIGAWEQGAKKQGKDIRAFKCEGAQSWEDVNKRATTLIKELVTNHIISNKQKKQTKVLVVSHGGFIMQFVNVVDRINGKPEKFDNSAKNCSMHQFLITYPELSYDNYLQSKVKANYILKNFVGHLA